MNTNSGVKTDTARPFRHRWRAAVASVGVTLLLGACSTTMTGMGGGDVMQSGKSKEPVLFSWSSDNDALSGTMVATLPNLTYKGPFFEITSETRDDSLAPLWTGWSSGWYDWPYWSVQPYAVSEFVTRYSGKVVANLSAPDGSRMRCRLHLVHPERGMAGGGQGECQISDGTTIQARF